MAAPAVLRKSLRGTFAELLLADMVFSSVALAFSFSLTAIHRPDALTFAQRSKKVGKARNSITPQRREDNEPVYVDSSWKND
jgi:hypothetical protein